MYGIRAGRLLAVADLMHIEGDVWELTRINVPAALRGQGYGRRLMERVLADADEFGVTLRLVINPYGEMTYEQLRDWYERCGFESDGRHDPFDFETGYFIRVPQEV